MDIKESKFPIGTRVRIINETHFRNGEIGYVEKVSKGQDGHKDTYYVHFGGDKRASFFESKLQEEPYNILEEISKKRNTDSQDEYLTEMAIGDDTPVKWNKINGKIPIAQNISVKDRETGLRYYLVPGTAITKIYVFAGKGTKKPIRLAKKLAEFYGGSPADWFHARGRCFVNINNVQEEGDLHWFECSGIGAVLREIKGWYPMKRKQSNPENTQNPAPVSSVLTEAGIVLENGETIKQGKVVEIARKAKVLVENGNLDDFTELMDGPEYDKLTLKERRILLGTEITNHHESILEMLAHIEVMNAEVPKDKE